jgi:hypothetical protein
VSAVGTPLPTASASTGAAPSLRLRRHRRSAQLVLTTQPPARRA